MLSELYVKIGTWIENTMYSIERWTYNKGLLYISGRDLIGVLLGFMIGIVLCISIHALIEDIEDMKEGD